MNELQVLNYNDSEIRTVEREDGLWWVLKDVCAAFGETNYRRVSGRIEEDEKGVSQITTPGGAQDMTVVNEAGLYSALFAMQPEKARGVSDEYIERRRDQLRKFKRWVTHEVLPSIRKHGAYMTPETIEAALLNPDTIIQLATTLKQEREQRMALAAKVEEDRPKVLFADAVDASHTSILIGDLAKLIRQNGVDIGQNRLFAWMRDNDYLIKVGERRNMPTQRAMDMELYEVKERTVSNPDGSVRITRTVKVTGKGQTYFINRFLAGMKEGA